MKLRRLSGISLILLISACGRDLQMDPRQTWNTEDIVQKYEVDIFYSESGFAYYVAKAVLATRPEYNSTSMKLPSGDTMVFNGVAMTWSQDNLDYRAVDTVLPTAFSFVWTHQTVSYTNALSPMSYPPLSIPTNFSKAEGLTLAVPGLPSEVTAIANINAGVMIKAPFYALPIDVDGTTSSVTTNFTGLSAGHGVLTLLETQASDLQAATAAGGTLTLRAQYGYHIIIGE